MIRVIPIMLLMFLCMHSAWGQQKGITETTFTANLTPDAFGCYWDITYTWSCTDSYYAWSVPHGIHLSLSGSTFAQSPAPTLTVIGGTWTWIGFPNNPTSSNPVINPTDVTWSQPETLSSTSIIKCSDPQPPAVIPFSTAYVKIKIYVALASGPQTITMSSLLYAGFSSGNHQFIDFDPQLKTISAPTVTHSAIPDKPSICKGKDTWVRLIPSIPPPAKIKWYKYSPPNCNDACLTSIPPASPWVEMNSNPPQPGVNNVPTNPLFQTTCYVAVIDSGCFRYLSTVARVEVCEPLTGISISSTPTFVPDPTSGTNRACSTWTGGLALNYTQCCPTFTTVTWTRSIDDGMAVLVNVTNFTITAPTNPSQCNRKYTYTATVSNACGTVTPSFTIYIDRKITADDITLRGNVWDLTPNLPSPLGPICYEQSARIKTRSRCGEIVEWQEMKWTLQGITPSPTDPNWTSIPGALKTPLYHTNKLKNPGPGIKSIWYRVKIKNGACPEVWSNPYEIRVKPELSVSLSPLVGRLCPPTPSTITLTATPSYTPVTYRWYRNEALITGSGPTKTVNRPGYYYVVVSDALCFKTAQSNVIKICSEPKVFIEGPCVVCEGDVFNLTALVFSEPEDCTSDCVTYLWTTLGGNIISPPNTQTITANQPGTYPGTYVVKVTCGTCTREARHTVGLCPPLP